LAHKSEDEKIEYRREWKRVYDSRSEVIAKRNSPAAKAKRKEYDARPTSIEAHRVFDALASSKAKKYERVYGVRFIDALPWFEIPVENRTCWLCGEKISGHMHLDHDHSALTVRGWTHPTCNQMEGMANKCPNPYRLLKTLLDLTAQGD
jgi:hypothetical protein